MRCPAGSSSERFANFAKCTILDVMTATSQIADTTQFGAPKRTRRPLPQVMTLTEAAAERIKSLMANAESNPGNPFAGVRVGVKNGGCAGMEYTLEYAEQRSPLDEVVEDRGVNVLVDPKAVLFLLGTEMDYEVGKLKSGFVFRNPNQTSACGCGESVAITPAKLEPADGDARG